MTDYLNVPEELLDQVVEPWHPQLGDRVRIVLNGECQKVYGPLSRYGMGGVIGHPEAEDGLIGTVSPSNHPSIPGHPYLVIFDYGPLTAIHYAACELEPLDEGT